MVSGAVMWDSEGNAPLLLSAGHAGIVVCHSESADAAVPTINHVYSGA